MHDRASLIVLGYPDKWLVKKQAHLFSRDGNLEEGNTKTVLLLSREKYCPIIYQYALNSTLTRSQ